MKALVCIYNPADLFPPTLNAVNVLATEFDEVVFVTTKKNPQDVLIVPPNVKLVYALSNMQAPRSFAGGLLRFLRFTNVLRSELKKEKFQLVLMYDPHTWLSTSISRWFVKLPPVVWYHSHDVYELGPQRRYSAGWFAVKNEQAHFSMLDIFSLPANERQEYFPVQHLKGKYFFIPNFPSVSFMGQFPKATQLERTIRLIYQGRLSQGHGFEEIIDVLSVPVNGKQLQLVLKGFIDSSYKDSLEKLAVQKGVAQQLFFYGPSAYIEVPGLTATCQVGLSIHKKTDIMTSTLGTSSNKTYEYAALGLPVILLDTPHFREHLGQFSWAFFTDCSAASIIKCIKEIDDDYAALTASAIKDFKGQLNFEYNFKPAIAYCKEKIRQHSGNGLNEIKTT